MGSECVQLIVPMSRSARKLKSFLFGLIGGISFGLIIVCVFVLDKSSLLPNGVDPGYDAAEFGGSKSDVDKRSLTLASLLDITTPDDTVSRELSQIRIFCWLYFRKSENFDQKKNATFNTWGRKCNAFIIFLDQHNDSLPAIGLDKVAEKVVLSDSAIISASRYVYKHHFNDADWFFSAESIPYVIMENLRHFLSDKDPDVPIYYGHRMRVTKHIPGLIYPDRCAGIVLSRGGLELLGTLGYSVPECDKYDYQLGIQFAQCMLQLGVSAGYAQDDEGRSRFLMFNMGLTIMADKNSTFEYRADEELSGRKGADRISTDLISIGRSGTVGNLGLDFFIYDLIKDGS